MGTVLIRGRHSQLLPYRPETATTSMHKKQIHVIIQEENFLQKPN